MHLPHSCALAPSAPFPGRPSLDGPGAGFLPRFGAGADALPLDRALAGLVAKGHGREACAAFLGLPDADLMAGVMALGLPTPADRPLRLGAGPRAWSLLDTRRLIDLWCRGFTGSAIGPTLGRSASAVYSKAGRLGLPTRPRASLLRGPPPLFPFPDPPAAAPEPAKPALERKGKRGEVVWGDALCREIEERWFCLQKPGGIGRDLGLTKSCVASAAHRLQLPCRTGIALHDDHDPARKAGAAKFFAGWTRRVCNIRKRPFWTRRAGVVFSDEARKQAAYREASAVVH